MIDTRTESANDNRAMAKYYVAKICRYRLGVHWSISRRVHLPDLLAKKRPFKAVEIRQRGEFRLTVAVRLVSQKAESSFTIGFTWAMTANGRDTVMVKSKGYVKKALCLCSPTRVTFGLVLAVMLSFALKMKNLQTQIYSLEENDRRSIRSKRSEIKNSTPVKDFDVGIATVYIRWARTTCSDSTELVYEGVMGGEHYTHVGGASDALCLPRNPIWGTVVEGFQDQANVYGAEYQFHSPLSSVNAEKVVDHNVPCAVCRVKSRSTTLMVPARNVCYPGWTLEYSGYLTAGHFNHKGRTQYYCIDKDPEADPAGFRDDNGFLLYTVEARCGSLPCPEYVGGRELTCAVCTK